MRIDSAAILAACCLHLYQSVQVPLVSWCRVRVFQYLSTIKPEGAGIHARAVQNPAAEQDIKNTLMDQADLHFSIWNGLGSTAVYFAFCSLVTCRKEGRQSPSCLCNDVATVQLAPSRLDTIAPKLYLTSTSEK